MSQHVLDQSNKPSGIQPGTLNYAVWGDSNAGVGIVGTGNEGPGVYGESNLVENAVGGVVGKGRFLGVFGYTAAANPGIFFLEEGGGRSRG